ncbi:hypothetical protein C8Q72DRAFT_786412, partial [Fomitopsis betulina]
GVDLPDIKWVIQWQATCSMLTLWQRLSRGAHNRSLHAIALFLVEKPHFDVEQKKAKE